MNTAPDKPDANALFARHLRFFYWLARQCHRNLAPHDPNWLDVEDLAGEFLRIAWQRFHNYKPARVSFPTWAKSVAWSHSAYLRQKARRLMRCRVAVSGTDAAGDNWLEREVIGREPEPWEILTEGEPDPEP